MIYGGYMKKIIKELSLFMAIVLSLVFIFPLNACALNGETSYVNISNTKNLEIEKINFFELTFRDYSTTSTQSFGLSGMIKNDFGTPIYYDATIYYYDYNYNLVAQSVKPGKALAGINEFSQMSNLSILGEHNVSEIAYYNLVININDNMIVKEDVASLTPSKNSEYSSYDYVIDSYDIKIIVNENNTFDVTETITAYFNKAKHGIIRSIPLKNDITRLDGSKSSNRVQITNVNVNTDYTTTKEDGNYNLKIGSADKTLTGEQKYIIKYTYNIGKDPVKDYDELYYNIIGDKWDTAIGNVTFTITMPKEFDSSKLGFSSGTTGSTDNSKIDYQVSEKTITGSYKGILDEEEALTIRCELPEGYFVGAGFKIGPSVYVMFIVPILGLLIAFILWWIFGRDDQVVETVEFYPPEGFNSLEVGFLYKGKADNRDVTSLMVYLANKGYIKISELEEKVLAFKFKNFCITKLKEYDGNNVNEQLFLNGLFSRAHIRPLDVFKKIVTQTKDSEGKTDYSESGSEMSDNFNTVSVTSMDLYDNFYITMNRILENMNDKLNKKKIFEGSTFWPSVLVGLLMVISLIIVVSIPTIDYGGMGEVGSTLFLCAFYALFFGIGIFFPGMPILFRIVWLGFTAFHSSMFFRTLPITKAILNERIYLIGVIVGLLCLIGMIVFLKLMPKRTKYGNEVLGKLRGFKNFLETAEKEKLEAMVMENPTYFYDILPFTYVLGVSDKWIKKFESIALQAPSWYDSNNAFDVVSFGNFMDSTMSSAQSAMSSSPSSSSSGGGSSGGGFSGGGSGGGGGSSW